MLAGIPADGMVDVFAEWIANAPVDRCGIPGMGFRGCSDLLKVRWQESFVAEGGRRLICHFRAPDAESVRLALRQADVAVEAVWSGTIHEVPARSSGNSLQGGDFSPPLPADTRRALAAAREECFVPNRLELTRAVVSSDGTRIIGVCDTPDGASLLPRPSGENEPDRVWRCRRLAANPDGSHSPSRSGISFLIWSDAGCSPHAGYDAITSASRSFS